MVILERATFPYVHNPQEPTPSQRNFQFFIIYFADDLLTIPFFIVDLTLSAFLSSSEFYVQARDFINREKRQVNG